MPQPEPILVYRLGSLGDTVVALPCFHLIRKVFPDRSIVLLTNEPVSGKAAPAMAILENSGLCDEVIDYPVGTRSFQQLAKVRRRLRAVRPQVMVNLAAGRGLLKSLRDYWFFRSCGVEKIIGTPFKKADLSVELLKNGQYEAESQRLAARLRPLGEIDLADRANWSLLLTPAEKAKGAEYVRGHSNFVAASVGTKLFVKDWGEDNWGHLLRMLGAELPGTTLVLLGADDERERSDRMGRLWHGPFLNLCGQTSPRISAAVLEHASLFIGHDSGPMHLASTLGIPTLGLFAWFNPPGQWFPGHHSWKSLKILYPPLPAGGWHGGLQMKNGPQAGVQLLKPDDVFLSAMTLWRAHSDLPA